MKKRFVLLASLLIFTICLFGQNNVKKYYKYVNKAELEYCKGNHKKASQFLEKAFQEKDPFIRDIYYYFYLYREHHVGDENVIIKQAHLLAQRGELYIDGFEENRELYNTLQTIKDTTQTTIIQPLIDSLQAIRNLDQSVRLGKFSYTEEDRRQILLTDSINLERIISLYKEFGTINENCAPYFHHSISLVLGHNSKENLIELPFDLLKEEVKKGNLDVRVFIRMYDECQANRKMFLSVEPTIQYGDDYGHHIIIGETLFIYPPENIKQINKNRKAIGYSETWEDFKIKLKFSFLEDGWNFVQEIVEHWGSDEETQKVEMETRQKIDNKEIKGEYYIKGSK